MFRQLFSVVPVVVALFAISAAATPATAQAPLSLELITESGFPIDGQRQWMDALQNLGITSVRIRGARPDEEPTITNRGTDDNPRYVVIGVLSQDNQLHLPGLTVRFGQRKQLTDWFTRVRGGGIDAVTGEAGAFGLTAKQFLALHEAVKPALTVPTKGKPVREVVQQIVDSLPVAVEIDAAVASLVASGEPVADELQGLSRSTALAAAVRPLGLVVTVTGQGQRAAGLRVTKPSGKEEAWPVGISPKGSPDKLVPALFKFINVDINDLPLSEALEAIRGRLDIPVLFDHLALAKHEIDLNAKVNLPPKKTFYKRIIDDLLFQAKLRSELKVDDADKPFLWVTSIKK
ncbi:MAG: hypothetical protein ACYC3X_04205 [Pirellulaceae bacterium]